MKNTVALLAFVAGVLAGSASAAMTHTAATIDTRADVLMDELPEGTPVKPMIDDDGQLVIVLSTNITGSLTIPADVGPVTIDLNGGDTGVGGDSDVPGTALTEGTGMRFTLGNAQRGIVEFTNDYRYPSPLTLWITDHADAGSGAVHLEFEPTLVDGVPLTADYVKSLASANRIRVAFADTEDKLKTAELQIATLRDPTARMSLDKGRVWITVRPPIDCTGHLAKIVIVSE